MKVWLSKEIPIQSMLIMNSAKLNGFWFKPTMTETNLSQSMILEESQLKKRCKKEEMLTSQSKLFWTASCSNGQLSTLQLS